MDAQASLDGKENRCHSGSHWWRRRVHLHVVLYLFVASCREKLDLLDLLGSLAKRD